MKTNDIKKDMRFKLRNGWFGTMKDNKKGNIRFTEVEGFYTELGSVYSHDILKVLAGPADDKGPTWITVEHTPAQLKLRRTVEGLS